MTLPEFRNTDFIELESLNVLRRFLHVDTDTVYILENLDVETQYQCVYNIKGDARLINIFTLNEYGRDFQSMTRTPEWKAALIVYQKYKTKLGLVNDDLTKVRHYIEEFSDKRTEQGKKCSADFLTQTASTYIKTLDRTVKPLFESNQY